MNWKLFPRMEENLDGMESAGAIDNSEVEESVEEEDNSEESADFSESEAETQEELQEEIEQAIEDGASAQQVQNMIKKFQLKVNGKVEEVEIDLNDEETLKRELQKARAFQYKAKEAAELQTTYKKALEELLNDPIAALQELGVDVNNLSAKHIMNQLEEEQKSPEQREKERLQKELELAMKQLKQIESEKERIRMEKEQAEAFSQLEKELDDAWKGGGIAIPRNPTTIRKVIDTLEWAEGLVDEVTGKPMFPNVGIADILPMVQDEYFKEMGEFFSAAPEEFMTRYGVSKKAEKAAKKVVPKKAPTNLSNIKDVAGSKVSEQAENKPKIRSADFFRSLK